MITIPTSGAYSQPNDSDITGDIFSSFGLDFAESKGKMRVGTRLLVGTSSLIDALLDGVPVAFREFNLAAGNRIIGLMGSRLVQSSADYPGGGFTDFAGAFPVDLASVNSDMEIYGSDLYLTGSQNLYKVAFGTTNVGGSLYASLGSGNQHKLCAFSGTGLLYVTDGNVVDSWNGSGMTTSGANSLTLTAPTKNNIAWIKAGTDQVWIGFNANLNSAGSRGSIFSWDGASIIPKHEYKMDSPGTFGCVIKDDVPWTMDAYGRLLAWNGGTFVEKARLNRRRNELFNMAAVKPYVHSNGMSLVNGKINILINGAYFDSTSSQEEQIPSGIWEYDEGVGLYHKHAPGLSTAAGAITDWGAQRVNDVGALQECNFPDSSASRNGTFLAGIDYLADATTSVHGVFYDDSNDTLQKAGTWVSPKLGSQGITDIWSKVFVTYRKLLAASDRITLKYRTAAAAATEITGTWASSDAVSTTFQTATDLTAYWTGGTGGEVEVTAGVGSGRCAHITAITLSGSTYSVTVDESIPGTSASSSTFKARVNAWTKVAALLPMTADYSEFPLMSSIGTTWAQLKMHLLFSGKDEINKVVLINKPQQLPS